MANLEKYLRKTALPHIWCPGCGHGIILYAIISAINKMNLDQNKTVIVSGIGCSSRAPGYLDFNTLHTAHGRALPFATGIKLANPELNVIVITGDGDATAIGGNHFIHAARRNIDLTTIVFNNSIYGMTGGQSSPLTPLDNMSTTAPYGQIERPFDIANLAIASGATYVARGTAFHTEMLTNLIAKGIENKGFSVIDAITQCPTAYGRRNKLRSGVEMLKWQENNSVRIEDSKKMSPKELDGKIIIGELFKSEAPEFTALYDALIKKVQGGSK